MTIDDNIRDESALFSGRIDQYENLTGEEIFPLKGKSPFGNAFQEQTEKQTDAIKSLVFSNKLKQIDSGIFPQNFMNNSIRTKLK